VDDAIPALAELGGELFSESLIVVCDENGTHIESSSDLRLETILHPSSAVNHAPLGGIGIPRTYPGRWLRNYPSGCFSSTRQPRCCAHQVSHGAPRSSASSGDQ